MHSRRDGVSPVDRSVRHAVYSLASSTAALSRSPVTSCRAKPRNRSSKRCAT